MFQELANYNIHGDNIILKFMHYDMHDIKHAHDNYAAYNAGYYNTDDVTK